MEKFLKFSRTASAELQHKINMSIIFNYLRENGPNPRSKIARELNISAPAVSRAIEKLINEGYVLQAEKQITKGGKRPTLIRINKDRGLVIGIDLGKEKLKIAVANFANEIVEKHEGFKISNGKDVVDKLEEEIAHILAKYNQEKSQNGLKIKGICIGIPADVDIKSGRIIS
ncbi:MAG: winged helix-turn-helix transcriptional regulator, partial [Actinobacteria bacterium]|nr:winged helix-turn-helix transcriptional regulator [Actinomycetota bacterium]